MVCSAVAVLHSLTADVIKNVYHYVFATGVYGSFVVIWLTLVICYTFNSELDKILVTMK